MSFEEAIIQRLTTGPITASTINANSVEATTIGAASLNAIQATIGTLGVTSVNGSPVAKVLTTANAASFTITAAMVRGAILLNAYSAGNVTLTGPTGTDLTTTFSPQIVGETYQLFVVNDAPNIVVGFNQGTDTTAHGASPASVANNAGSSSYSLLFRWLGANTWDVYFI